MVHRMKSSRGLRFAVGAVGVVAALWVPSPLKAFMSGSLPPLRKAGSSVKLAAEGHKCPELQRVEELIYDSCMLQDGEQEVQCLLALSKLTKFHEQAALECKVDEFHCLVLDVLDRLCAGIQGSDGLILLNRVADAVLAFREKFSDLKTAFKAVDVDGSGDLDLDEFIAAMRSVDSCLTEEQVKMIFVAADANGDGAVCAEEFSNFLTAAIFVEEPLRRLQVDSLPKKQPTFEEYLRWSMSGRSGSWAAMR
mmetsp:Transcript_31060/g.78605  ORF Transcript_31060/g.78605 Transcript_31060/m.78605 type:complete len:251 (+) Transcript_31060:97-849(+)